MLKKSTGRSFNRIYQNTKIGCWRMIKRTEQKRWFKTLETISVALQGGEISMEGLPEVVTSHDS